ncbi:hypothetical protein ACVOMV_24330 [Mesorhizobium atlanticum]
MIGKPTAIFAGRAVDKRHHGEQGAACLVFNYAGSNPLVQSHFLVVGVEGDKTGLYGTSFAAPIISGYAAIIGSKFTKATPVPDHQ